jgi:glyoxylase-like metal-dependent hydrolase (beta-lactamase superfamily II)
MAIGRTSRRRDNVVHGIYHPPVTPYQQNCSLVWDTDNRAALIDPGGEAERLLAEVAARGLTLEKILLTHGHLDHVGAAAELRDALGIPIIGPQREDRFWLDALPQQAEMFGFPPLLVFSPDQWLEDGDTVEVGSIRSRCCTAPAIPQATWFSTRPRRVSPSSATCCSRARSAAAISRVATMPH